MIPPFTILFTLDDALLHALVWNTTAAPIVARHVMLANISAGSQHRYKILKIMGIVKWIRNKGMWSAPISKK